MDGLDLKPARAIDRSAYRKRERTAKQPTAQTDVPAAQAVTPADNGGAQKGCHHQAREQAGQTGPDYLIDPQTRDLIYRAVDIQSDPAGENPATEAALKIRAYRNAPAEQPAGDASTVTKTV
jgi:hypothetical protein